MNTIDELTDLEEIQESVFKKIFVGFLEVCLLISSLTLVIVTMVTYQVSVSEAMPRAESTEPIDEELPSSNEKAFRRGYLSPLTTGTDIVVAGILNGSENFQEIEKLDEEFWGQVSESIISDSRTSDLADFESKEREFTKKGRWKFLWDESYLWVGVEVTDKFHVQIHDDINAECGDSLKILISSLQNGKSATLSSEDYSLLLSPGNFAGIQPNFFRFQGQSSTNTFTYQPVSLSQSSEQVQIQAEKIITNDVYEGYFLEAIIPWQMIGITPNESDVYQFAVEVIDNDQENMAIDGAIFSNNGGRKTNNPSSWGELRLEN